ncbi:hypothetical protein DUNSADRAFT_12082 [Dunaliella salina]|uniref:SPRY domain-containing protein n=1 Tax=Dunaliella salina TaxID=3046 RepID=A0ABQ7H446_DUNSA|nr:hypothetical protein DUNSADRAFT_12082 [Dunaliella salina]|eukprot:KAF5841626.1 hypothetical protein DUNSADRAFT_12082 [Dunaliella salina]
MGASNSKRDVLEGLPTSQGPIAVSPGQWASASSSLEHVSSLPGVREAQGRHGSLPEVTSSIPLASASAHVNTATASTATPSAPVQVSPTSPTATAPLPPTTATTSAPAPSPPAAHPSPSTHKSTTLIPGWSRTLSSQQLQIECQKVARPSSTPGLGGPLSKAGPREDLGVLEMEVMKFVAYCGGVSIKFRIDEVLPLPLTPHGSATAPLVWGLASTRACTALLQTQQQQPPPTAAFSSTGRVLPPPLTIPSDNGSGSSGSSGTGGGSQGALRGGGVLHPPNPATSVTVDSPSRKPLYATCTASMPADAPLHHHAARHGRLLARSHHLQPSMYPFITMQPGMAASLHEATTPSPLFTWYHPAAVAPSPDVTLAELDTCVTFQAPPSAGDPPTPPASLSSTAMDFMGSATFTSGRHRWTVQLDNFGAAPVNIFVGVAASADSHTLAHGGTHILSQGPLRSIAGSASTAAAEPASGGPCSPGAAPVNAHSSSSSNSCSRLQAAGVAATTAAAGATSPSSAGAGPSGFAAAEQGSSSGSSSGSRFARNSSAGGLARLSTGPMAHATSFAASPSSTPDTSGKSGGALLGDADTACSAPSRAAVSSLSCKWGAWVHLPGSASAGPCPPDAYTPPHPPRSGFTHTTQATSSHCFVTVDLDLHHGYVRFFRNGHIIGAAFYGLAGPISPMLAFAHAPNLHCQAGLVNLTKLRQLDLTWNADKCSADLRLSGSVVSKGSSVSHALTSPAWLEAGDIYFGVPSRCCCSPRNAVYHVH